MRRRGRGEVEESHLINLRGGRQGARVFTFSFLECWVTFRKSFHVFTLRILGDVSQDYLDFFLGREGFREVGE